MIANVRRRATSRATTPLPGAGRGATASEAGTRSSWRWSSTGSGSLFVERALP
jgi:hypothetical protein